MIAGTRFRLNQQVGLQTRLSQQIARDLSDISTRKRLQGASDDPAAAARIADIQRGQTDRAGYAANAKAALSLSDRVETSLDTVASNVDRAKTLMLAAGNATLSASDRETIAVELEGIATDLASLSGEKDSRGQPLYAATGQALAYPVDANVTVQAGATRDGVFDSIPTADGPKALADILAAAAAAVRMGDVSERNDATTASIAEIDAAAGSIADARGEQGVRATRLAAIQSRLEAAEQVDVEERSGLEDTDIDGAVIRLKARMTALEAAQAVLAKVTQTNLFDRI